MKKLLIEIFTMMLMCMGLVFAILGIARLILRLTDNYNTEIIYHVSLVAGVCGLLLFALFLNLFLLKRLKKISRAVNEVAKGNYEVKISDKGIDEIKNLTDNFNTMTAELKSNEYLSRNFVRNVSHEMKTPLSTIIGYAELIERATDTEFKEYSEIIKSEAKNLLNVGQQMLEISRMDSSVVINLDDVFRVDEQIRDIILKQQNVWVPKEIELNVDMERIEWKGNEELTRHIWQNLVSNAVKFTPQKGNITILLYKKSDQLFFQISNSGKKIPDEVKPYIFDSFFTYNENNNRQGSGLGLSIVKKIVDKINGMISVNTDSNETVFTVILKRIPLPA